MSDVLLVGSSGELLKQELGTTIDTFEHVVRFNSYSIQGFEKHVGTKEKIWACNLGLALHFPSVTKYVSKGNTHVWYVGNNYQIELKMMKLKKMLKKQFVIESLNFGVVEYIESLQNEFKDEKLCFKRNKIRVGNDEKYATTGLRAIFKCLERFGKAHICGFTSYAECTGNMKNSHYYPINEVPKHMHTAYLEHPDREHDVKVEKRIISKLKQMGLLEEL